MGIGIVIVQGALGAVFLFSGGFKLLGPTQIVKQWAAWRLPQWFRLVTGVVEVAGGFGLLLGISLRWVGPLAGLWLAATMVGAIVTHLRVHDSAPKMAPAATLLVLAAAVAIQGWPALAQLLS